jgi:hypothetical protein
MLGPKATIIDHCIQQLQQSYRSIYGTAQEPLNLLTITARNTLNQIAQTNAAYHNVEHTALVTLAGQEILQGKHRSDGNVSAQDWLHTIISLLYHDIGYIRGICRQDCPQLHLYSIGHHRCITLPAAATDASLAPFHIERAQQLIDETLEHPLLDREVLKHNIEMTRFPVSPSERHCDTNTYAALVRAADLIGQLSDPDYLAKLPSLFQEFQEVGSATQMGYDTAEDLCFAFPRFYGKGVAPYIQPAIAYLQQTKSGKTLLTRLRLNLWIVEKELQKSDFFGELNFLTATSQQVSPCCNIASYQPCTPSTHSPVYQG